MSSPVTTFTSGLDQNFLEEVSEDVNGRLDDARVQALHAPEMAQARYTALLALKKGVESQLAHHKGNMARKYIEFADDPQAWEKFRAERLTWRGGAIRFLSTVEAHILAVKTVMAENNSDEQDATYLRGLITEHYHSLVSDGIQFTEADRALHDAAKIREGTA